MPGKLLLVYHHRPGEQSGPGLRGSDHKLAETAHNSGKVIINGGNRS